jgi:prenylcysteine oxidase/farnesylcysteine lyase
MVLTMLKSRPRIQLLLTITVLVALTYFLAQVPDGSSFPTFPPEPDFAYPRDAHPGAVAQGVPKRVAIIGAGASGSAAAFFLSRAGDVMRNRVGKGVLGEITVFERDDRVGGRE